MAMANARCKCSKCGTYFTVSKKCHSREEADNFESWAESCVDMCQDCKRSEKQDRDKAVFSELSATYVFPEIDGVSEKQINYADNLRQRYVANNQKYIDKANKVIARLGYDIPKADLDAAFLYQAYVCLTEKNAHKIIDTLKW